MYTDYLKTKLNEIIDSRKDVERIEANSEQHGSSRYAYQAGAFGFIIRRAEITAASALSWVTDHIEPREREAERLIGVIESLGVDLDEAAIDALGKLAADQCCRSERAQLAGAINKAIAEYQELEREREHDDAIEALNAAGFTFDKEDETYNRGHEQARIDMAIGRGYRFKWEYETSDPVHTIESGISGSFSRLLALIATKSDDAPLAVAGSQAHREVSDHAK